MDRTEFDRFADKYASLHARNIRLSGEEPEFFARYKVEDVRQVLASERHDPRFILDFGAGVGASVSHWRGAFPNAKLVCLDISRDSIDVAREQHGNHAEFRVYDGQDIPFPSEQFDVVFAACVFHHIDAARQVPLLAELRRVLNPDGSLFIFEHNPLNPLTVHAVNTCEFDVNAVLLRSGELRRRVQAAGFDRISLAYRIFFPGALRVLRPLEQLLTWLPLGAQYRLVAKR